MKILCVDDEPLALQMLELSIQKAKPDADVIGFDEPEDLLDEAKENGCDIAFLDIHMSEMDGVELAKRLKEINPKMNIIFVTGFSEYTGDAMRLHASGYVMKPVTKEKIEAELKELRFPFVPKDNTLLKVQCFGNFDVFTPDGKPLHFERSKAKEVFAYLVHRQGSSCSKKEIAAILFEDMPYDNKQQIYVQKIIAAMMKALKQANAEQVINKAYNNISVKTDLIDCDYYRFKELDAGAVNAYQNEYMSQYYWADFLYDSY